MQENIRDSHIKLALTMYYKKKSLLALMRLRKDHILGRVKA